MSATPWEAPSDTTPEPAPPRQKRQARKPREASRHPPGHDGRDLPEAPKAARKTRGEAAETIKVTIKEFAEMRVGAEDAKLFVKLHGVLSELTKASRSRLLAELTKVLA